MRLIINQTCDALEQVEGNLSSISASSEPAQIDQVLADTREALTQARIALMELQTEPVPEQVLDVSTLRSFRAAFKKTLEQNPGAVLESVYGNLDPFEPCTPEVRCAMVRTLLDIFEARNRMPPALWHDILQNNGVI